MNIRTFKSIVIRKGFKVTETENNLLVIKKTNRKFICQDFRKDKIKSIKDESLEYMLFMMEVELNENL